MTPSSLSSVYFDPARRTTPATEQATSDQVKSDQGGFVFTIDDMARAQRFLILGSEASFYKAGAKLSLENAEVISRLAKSDKVFDLIDLIADISVHGRAPKQSPGLFALAAVINQAENDQARYYAYQHLPLIARTSSTLFEFTGYLSQFQGLGGMGFQKAIGRWYNEKPLDKLAYQMVKYRQRGGYDHSRLLRLSKRVRSNDRPELGPLLDWALGKEVNLDTLPKVVIGYELAKIADRGHDKIVRDYGLSWEMLPTEVLNDVKVWEALLEGNVPLEALIRQLPRLTNLGMLTDLGGWTGRIEERLTNEDQIKKARIHPLKALVAQRTYLSGQGESQTWRPVGRVGAALEQTFYKAFDYVEPTGKKHMLAVDVSGSMTTSRVAGMPVNPREAAAVMAMVQARIEPEYLITGFADGGNGGGWYLDPLNAKLVQLNITRNMRLNDVLTEIGRVPMGGTNLSLPMETALEQNLDVDAFVVYTDNELGLGRRHPFQALAAYRREMKKPNAKLVVAAMTATNFTIADPSDPGMLDIAGFDTAAPGLIADFVR